MVCSLYKFFYNDVVLAGAAASVFVCNTGFFDVGGAVNAFAACQINGFYDDRGGELRDGGFKICVAILYAARIFIVGVRRNGGNGNCSWCRDAETCC